MSPFDPSALLAYYNFLWVPMLAFALTALLIPAVKPVARRFGVVGVAIVMALSHALPKWMVIGGTGLLVVGIIDDSIALKPKQKLIAQVVLSLASVLVYHNSQPLTPWHLTNWLVEVLWLLATINAYNLVDGLDGLAGGVGIIASLAIAITCIFHGHEMLSLQALALAGGLAGFMLYNLHPATIFMGDAGALPIGLMLGIMAIQAGALANNSHLSRYVFPVIVLILPLLDTTIVTVTRIATGNSISRRGLDHSHHRLLHLGLTTRRAVAVGWGVAASGAITAVLLTMIPHRYVLMGLPLVILVFAVAALFMMDLTFDSRPPGLAYGYLQGVARFILNVAYRRRLVELALDSTLIITAYFGANLLRRNFSISEDETVTMMRQLPWIVLPTYLAFILAGVYRGIWRYAGLSEIIRFANGSALAGIFIALLSLVGPLSASSSLVILDVILLFNLLVTTRMSFRALRKGIHRLASPRNRVLIVGAGVAGSAAADYVFSGQHRNFTLVGFVDDDAFKLGKLVDGYRVLGTIEDLEKIRESPGFDQIMVATDALDADRMALVANFAKRHDMPISRFSMQIRELGHGDGPARRSGPIFASERPLGT
jgi:UDP-GlcNAc:undecaprenyl-phosphate GlcNAc-1-phosphate transferase